MDFLCLKFFHYIELWNVQISISYLPLVFNVASVFVLSILVTYYLLRWLTFPLWKLCNNFYSPYRISSVAFNNISHLILPWILLVHILLILLNVPCVFLALFLQFCRSKISSIIFYLLLTDGCISLLPNGPWCVWYLHCK
jgi:hypothetical protein